ncbi:beta glucosidase 17 [Euphorbia peplus]|nr:beta glucosidase 17 [Euphorbia peplus]
MKREVLIMIMLLLILINNINLTICSIEERLILSRNSFPDGFVFGAASSSYQFEGAASMGGRKPSIWDTFTRDHPEKIADHSNGNVADDFYHRFQNDIPLLKEIGLDSYRFSISWSRILPEGKISRGVNWEGVNFYNSLINSLLAHGIEPFVTLFHWDLPQALEDEYDGFLSSQIVNDYYEYVNLCFKEFGDRVKYWVTINEPNTFSIYGYAEGKDAPGRCSNYIGNCSQGNSGTEPYLVLHNLILCHATVVKLYRDRYQASQGGTIGISITAIWYVPKYHTIAAWNATSALDFSIGWILDPISVGEYPEVMRYLVGKRLPKFTEEEAQLIKGSFDFIGINYYSSSYADDLTTSYTNLNQSYTTDSRVNVTSEKDGIPIGEKTDISWLFMYPKGIQQLTRYLSKRYNNPTIYITENGMAYNSSWSLEYSLNDTLRIKYHSLHLSYLLKSIKEGADVRGYYIWSFLDDFEWALGYTAGFGITYIDYKNNLKRYLKQSAFWFQKFLQHGNPTQSSTLFNYYIRSA